jgi:hypothetical protein
VTSACGAAHAARAADPPALVRYSNGYIAFRHPAAWKAYPFRWAGELHFHPLVYLSTQPVHDPCATHGNTTACTWPVRRLRPGGVLIVWGNFGYPGWSLREARGFPLRVADRPAKRVALRPGRCGAIGGDLTVEVAIARPEPSNWTEATACVRSPHLGLSERRIDALLASTRFLSQ